MRKIRKILMGIGLSLVMLTETSLGVYATTQGELQQRIDSSQNELNRLDEQISELQEKQDLLEEELDDMNAELINLYTSIDVLQDEILATESDISAKQSEIALKEGEIEEAQAEYDRAKAEEDKQYAAMKKRIQFLYESGSSSYAELLLSSKSMGDLLDRTEYIEDIYAYDRKMLQSYRDLKEEVANLQVRLETEHFALENEKAGLESVKAQLEEDKADLLAQQDYLNTLIAQKKATSNNYEAEIASARETAKTYKNQIAADNKRLKEMQEEERKRLEEEARKATQEATGNTQNSTSSGSSVTTAPANASNAEKIAAAQAVVAASSGSDLGKQIAIYACQFIGNPYVLGGTSLTNGTDCSGFTFRIYANFGYKLPRTSYLQRSAGTEVPSLDQAQPGDLICYEGHVAMYMGSGKIVHASSQKTGIKTSNATYKPIITIRRIIG